MHIYTKDEVCMTIYSELSIDSKPKKIGTTYLYLSALKNFRLLITIFAAIFMA